MHIDKKEIQALIEGADASIGRISSILDKAAQCRGLKLEEAAVLLKAVDKDSIEAICKKAGEVKERVFGKRIVLFAPLYLSNYCTNGCLYCGFKSANRDVARRALTPDEAVREAGALEEMGFKRVLLVTGEDARYGVDYIVDCVRAVYAKGGMRIVHVNAPPMDADSFRKLKASGAGVYQSFQETYHRPTYEHMHPTGRKRDFKYRLDVMDRAVEAGFGDVGIGALLGLYDFRFESLATIAHSYHLYETFGTHAHTISIPRLRPALWGLDEVPCPVTDDDLKKIVAVFRLSVPTAGVVVSTRERADLRSELIRAGGTQMSAGSRTNPGGYSKEEGLEQFSTNDTRSIAEVMRSIIDEGLLPSLCTTCYRVGRTGHDFTEKTGAGEMEKFCQANAVLTLKEYLLDHVKNGSREAVQKAVDRGLKDVDETLKKAILEKLKALEEGQRDLYF